MARPTSKYRGGFERCSTISWRACPRIAGRRFATNWTCWIGSPALYVDCAGVTPTFGLGDRHAYLERRMKKFWPVPDCRIEQIIPDGPTQLRIAARSFQRARRCPDCGRASRAVHSRYERHLADLPSLGRSVSVHLWVRRFYCRNAALVHVWAAPWMQEGK